MTTMWLIAERPFWSVVACTVASAGPAATAVTNPVARVSARRNDRDILASSKTPVSLRAKAAPGSVVRPETKARERVVMVWSVAMNVSTGLESLICELVAIESVNPDIAASCGGETAIAGFVASWLRAEGLLVEVVEPVPGRPSVVGVLRGSGGGRSLMLNAHMDTVGAGGMAAAFSPVVREGRVYGRGAYDMKGSLAAIMITAREAARLRLRGDLIVTAVADEEVASLGTSAVLEKFHADFGIVTEPTELQLCLAHKGFVWLEVETHGVAAHGSRADLGVDAIAHMGRVLLERPPSEVAADHPISRAVASAAADPALIGVAYWMDMALLNAAGVPAVAFGPEGEGAHADLEWVDLASVERCVQVYLQAAELLCN